MRPLKITTWELALLIVIVALSVPALLRQISLFPHLFMLMPYAVGYALWNGRIGWLMYAVALGLLFLFGKLAAWALVRRPKT